MIMTLTRGTQNSVIDFIEAYNTAMGEFPGRSLIVNAIVTAVGSNPNPQEVDEFLEDESFIRSLDERGIIPPWELQNNPVGLSREQLAVASALNSIKDRRSDSKKLADLGISTRKFQGWMHSKTFTNYMKLSANNLLENAEAEAHMGLLRSLGNNNVAAQKLYFEMTGRWNPAYEDAVNVQELMTGFIEIIQKHLGGNTELMLAIAADLQMISLKAGYNPREEQRTPVGSAPVDRPAIENNDPRYRQPERKLIF